MGFSSHQLEGQQNIAQTGDSSGISDHGSGQAHERDRGAHVGPEVDEFEVAGLTAVPGKLVNVPRVGESPVAFECKVSDIVRLKGADGKEADAWLTLGEVVAVHIDKAMIKDGVYQTAAAGPIVRAGRRGDYFEIKPENMFEMIPRTGLGRASLQAVIPGRAESGASPKSDSSTNAAAR